MALPEPLDPVFVGGPLPTALNEERDAINSLIGEVDARIEYPSGAMTGDLLRFNGVKWVTTETRFLEGNGRPDGSVAAPVGSRYIDKVAQQGAVEWIKRGGADTNTGWICLGGDTGSRNVASLVNKRTTAEVFVAVLRRIGVVVELYLDLSMPNNEDSPWDVLQVPSGFRPNGNRYGMLQDNREGAALSTAVMADGTVNLYGIVKTKRDRWNATWTTDDAWPSSLPGSVSTGG